MDECDNHFHCGVPLTLLVGELTGTLRVQRALVGLRSVSVRDHTMITHKLVAPNDVTHNNETSHTLITSR